MDRKTQLLDRLDAIGHSLALHPDALCLLGLGSAGLELERLDEFSDLDFFVLVQPGSKRSYIQNLDWLESVEPLVYRFQNTPDGYKALFADGIFIEFAVFEPQELPNIPFAAARLVWAAPGWVDPQLAEAIEASNAAPSGEGAQKKPVEWLLGEALTNLYVGLARYRRGELLSAMRFVQGYAVDRVVELFAHLDTAMPGVPTDPFTPERRVEARYPALSAALPLFLQGYERTPESASALLSFLEVHFVVPPALSAAIRNLISPA